MPEKTKIPQPSLESGSQNIASDTRRVVSLVKARWKTILAAVVLGAVLGYISGFVIPRQYESQAVIFSKSKPQTPNSIISMSGEKASQCSYMISLMTSRPLREVVKKRLTSAEIKKLGLNLENAQTPLTFSRDDNAGIITTICRSSDPKLSARFINMVLDELEKNMVNTSGRNAAYIQKSIDRTQAQIEESADDLEHFQSKHKIFSEDGNAKSIEGELFALKSKVFEIDASLSALDSQLKDEVDPDVLVSLRVQRAAQQASRDEMSAQVENLNKELADYPAMAKEYATLLRKHKTLESTYEILCGQYQVAALPRSGENGDYEIIERAVPVYEAVFPRKKTMCLLGAVIALVFAVEFVLIKGGRKTTRIVGKDDFSIMK